MATPAIRLLARRFCPCLTGPSKTAISCPICSATSLKASPSGTRSAINLIGITTCCLTSSATFSHRDFRSEEHRYRLGGDAPRRVDWNNLHRARVEPHGSASTQVPDNRRAEGASGGSAPQAHRSSRAAIHSLARSTALPHEISVLLPQGVPRSDLSRLGA